MATISTSFTAVGNSAEMILRPGDFLTYTGSGTYAATFHVEYTNNGGASWTVVRSNSTADATVTDTVRNDTNSPINYRFRVSAYTSGTLVTTLVESTSEVLWDVKDKSGNTVFAVTEAGVAVTGSATVSGSLSQASSSKYFVAAPGQAKAGTTAGWVVAAGNDTARVTLPASQTASTLVIPITGLKVGWTITAFHLVGQIESAGGTVTVDASLFKLTAAAADLTDASIGAITQLTATADTIISATNASKTLATAEVIAADESFYVLVTATTAASTDIDLMGVAVTVTEV